MNRVRAGTLLGTLLTVVAAGCLEPTVDSEAVTSTQVLAAAKGAAGGPTVQTADPSYGHQGDAGLTVTITGSGFDQGSKAGWEQDGVPDPKITVVATQFVSSSQLIATVNIATDADLAFYDIAVITSRGRKGIGTEQFEVTQANVIEGVFILRAANENGELAGGIGGARYWTQATGLIVLPTLSPDVGGVWAIDEAGTTMSGFDGAGYTSIPVWTRVAGVWQHGVLPEDPAAIGGSGRSIASDPGSGQAVFIGGHENFKAKGNSSLEKPRLWRQGLAGWERIVLPSLAADGNGIVEDVTPSGVAVGNSNGRAVIWEPNGSGGWTIAYLPGTQFTAKGINSFGDLIVGGGYWLRSGGTWTFNTLPPSCGGAKAVDDLGRIAAACDQPRSNGPAISGPAILIPPYSSPPIFLGGLGKTGVVLEKMSLRGSWIVGQGNSGSTHMGVYWKVF